MRNSIELDAPITVGNPFDQENILADFSCAKLKFRTSKVDERNAIPWQGLYNVIRHRTFYYGSNNDVFERGNLMEHIS